MLVGFCICFKDFHLINLCIHFNLFCWVQIENTLKDVLMWHCVSLEKNTRWQHYIDNITDENLLDTIDVSLTNFLLRWWHFLVCRTTEPFPKQHNIKKRYTSQTKNIPQPYIKFKWFCVLQSSHRLLHSIQQLLFQFCFQFHCRHRFHHFHHHRPSGQAH